MRTRPGNRVRYDENNNSAPGLVFPPAKSQSVVVGAKLNPSTSYEFYAVELSAAGLLSNIVSASFTTLAAARVPPALRTGTVTNILGQAAQLDFTSSEADGTIYWVLTAQHGNPARETMREMGGAPRNPAPRNHFWGWIAKP